jgi:hypothetical protein
LYDNDKAWCDRISEKSATVGNAHTLNRRKSEL